MNFMNEWMNFLWIHFVSGNEFIKREESIHFIHTAHIHDRYVLDTVPSWYYISLLQQFTWCIYLDEETVCRGYKTQTETITNMSHPFITIRHIYVVSCYFTQTALKCRI